MMQLRPIRAPRRMWTLSQTLVPSPSATPGSTSAVGWTQAGASCAHAAARTGSHRLCAADAYAASITSTEASASAPVMRGRPLPRTTSTKFANCARRQRSLS